MFNKPHRISLILFLILGIGVSILAIGRESWVLAEDTEGTTIKVTITGKSEETNQVFVVERPFRVPPGTPIRDYHGRSLTLNQLLVPCVAEITYKQSSSRELIVDKIRVR